jgi:Ca-activated chloride channel family protein
MAEQLARMLEGFRFYSPWMFALAPLVALAVWFGFHPRRRGSALFSSVIDLKSLPVTPAQRIRRMLPWMLGLGFLLLLAALARPQRGRSDSRIKTEGIAIEAAIDISYSMLARDFELNGKTADRITAVKHVLAEFVGGSAQSKLPGRPNDLVGLVTFTGLADSRCPLTLDHAALLEVIKSVESPKPKWDGRGRRGRATNPEELSTAIGDGLALAVERLKSVDAASKVVILLSDGDNNSGEIDPKKAMQLAKAQGIRVYSIGIGSNGVAPFPEEDEDGDIQLVGRRFSINEALLREIAETNGGRYFHASNTQALADVYAEIDQLEKSKVEEVRYTEHSELYHWLAVPGLVLILFAGLLFNTRFRSLP